MVATIFGPCGKNLLMILVACSPSIFRILTSMGTIVAGPALQGLDGLDAVGGPVRPAAQARA